jgi:MoxR-like ATPase
VDAQHCLAIRDVSLQSSRLTLPGVSSSEPLPGEITDALDALESELRSQRHQFSQHQRCLFISDDWLARVETSLQDVAEQLKQARK